MARLVASGFLAVLSVALATAGQPEVGGAGHLTADDGADDLVALIQHRARPQRRGAAAASLRGRSGRLARRARSKKAVRDEPFDCSAHPELCKEPFNCDKWAGPAALMEALERAGSAVDWKANYQLWCMDPVGGPYGAKCAAGDLDGAGKLLGEIVKAGALGEHIDEVDASYCFIEGHCADSDVTNDTTVDDMLRMCDERFGRDAWTNYSNAAYEADMVAEDAEPNTSSEAPADFMPDQDYGFTSSEQTRPLVLAGCAMGNYHCDVRYCQANYCHEAYYVKKYGHFLKDYGWVQ